MQKKEGNQQVRWTDLSKFEQRTHVQQNFDLSSYQSLYPGLEQLQVQNFPGLQKIDQTQSSTQIDFNSNRFTQKNEFKNQILFLESNDHVNSRSSSPQKSDLDSSSEDLFKIFGFESFASNSTKKQRVSDFSKIKGSFSSLMQQSQKTEKIRVNLKHVKQSGVTLKNSRNNFNNVKKDFRYTIYPGIGQIEQIDDSEDCDQFVELNESFYLKDEINTQKQNEPQERKTKLKKKNKKKRLEITKQDFKNPQRTTLMIKNIPNKYTKKMMLGELNKRFKNSYDFFYLPIDFENNCNLGYAFINFKKPKIIESFYKYYNKKKWKKFKSEKICEISFARIQGQEKLISHFSSTQIMKQDNYNLKPFIQMKSKKQ